MPSLATPLCERLGCRLPVLLAGMGGVSRHRLAAAVANAGGFGVLGMVREPVERIRDEVAAFRQLSDHRFAVNLIPAATPAADLKRQVDTCLDLQVPVLSLFWEVDGALVRHLKAEGVQVIHQVGNRRDAELAIEAGADVLILQGVEAGGHVRAIRGLFTLLPEIVRLSPVPVAAAGGIASGRGIAAALALGAQGVSIGTAFIATHESNAHAHHQQRIVDAGGDDTIYTTLFQRNWHEPAPVRVLHNGVTRGDWAPDNPALADRVIGQQDGQPVYLFSTDSPLAGATGDVDTMALYAGQGCGDVGNIGSAAERLQQLVDEARDVLAALAL